MLVYIDNITIRIEIEPQPFPKAFWIKQFVSSLSLLKSRHIDRFIDEGIGILYHGGIKHFQPQIVHLAFIFGINFRIKECRIRS